MGLVDQVLGMFGKKSGSSNPLLSTALGMLGGGAGAAGLSGVLSKFEGAGLGDAVQSWVGTGANKAISADDVTKALGPDEVKKVAQQAGVSEHEAAGGLAGMLPDIVNKVTPDGKLPDVSQLSNLLGGLLKK